MLLSGTGNRLFYETCGFSVFLTNATSISDYSVPDPFHTFSNSLFASDLLVSEITRLIQWPVYRLDDRETEFRYPIREWNFFLSVASRSALGCNHTLVQWLRGGFFYPALKKFTTGRRDWEFVELYLHSPFVLWRIKSGNLMCAVFIGSFIFFVTDSLQSRNTFLSPCHQSCQ